MPDTFGPLAPQATDPPQGAAVIDYSGGDQTITRRVRGVYISSSGTNLKVDMADGTTVTFSNLAQGLVHPMCIIKIYQTGSTAAGLILY